LCVLSSRGGSQSLVHLSLAGNGMGDEGAKSLAIALSNDSCPLLEELHLHGNSVGDKGLAAVASAMADRHVPYLRVLRLHDNRNIGAAGVKALSSALNIIKPVLEEVRKWGRTKNKAELPPISAEHHPVGGCFIRDPRSTARSTRGKAQA